ncbi:hypothetical protein DF3PA_80022 [Candidatus Defluviicoccus seviourii]|uniref:Uncharacterized protein n=1 Tax=Candidatus Defluviicoccus seviourii TaxID=2565273 RepID=A0A564WHD9_9PROT|nr:hypothetical protein DF3PA_80022 [Candidatus Defluviicoccus seviourii]
MARPKTVPEDVPEDGAGKDVADTGPRYVVQSPLLHDGTPCIPGDTVPGAMFTADQIAYLVACGTLTPIEPEPAAE